MARRLHRRPTNAVPALAPLPPPAPVPAPPPTVVSAPASRRVPVAVAVLSGLIAAVELLFPFGRDQGNYAYPAWAWLQGQMPYRDVYVFKPPATVWVHALAQVLFGHSMTAVRILDVGWTAATSLTIYAIARRWFDTGTAVAAGLLYAFLYANFDFWNTCQTDGWLNLPVAVGVLSIASPASRRRTLLLGGAALGLAFLFKYTALLFAVLVAAATGRSVWRRLPWVAAGFLAVIGLTAAWLAVNQAIPAFLDSQLGLVPAYVVQTGKTTGILDKGDYLWARFSRIDVLRFIGVTAVIGAVAAAVTRDRRAALPALWFVLGLGSAIAQDKYFRYHFLPTIPGAAILGAVAIRALARRLPVLVVVPLVVVALLLPSRLPNRWGTAAGLALGEQTLDHYWHSSGFVLNKLSVGEAIDCARAVQARSARDDGIFIWGFDPMIAFIAERRIVSRFLYDYPFAVAWGNPAYPAELMSALEAEPPKVFVIASDDATPQATGTEDDSRVLFERFDALGSFVADRYGPAEPVGRYSVHGRNP